MLFVLLYYLCLLHFDIMIFPQLILMILYFV